MNNQSDSSTFSYHAFVSYRHADNKEQGRQWATWLHQAIETYEVPADLVGKENERGEKIPARIFPIFRDEEELPAHADLGATIVKALNSSRLLVVLCSPRAVASTYVADEIVYFKKLGRSNSIMAALLDGEPNASWDEGKLSTGFTIADECFPVPLQFEYDEQGDRTTKRAEPIAADFRINNDGQPEQAWTTPEAYRQHLKNTTRLTNPQIQKKIDEYDKQQHLMLLKIIAGILGLPLGELTRRDKEYQLEQARLKAKRLMLWLAAVAVLAVLAAGAGVTAYFKQVEAEEQRTIAGQERDSALLNQSNFLIDLAKQENDKGNYDSALLLGLNALPGKYGGNRPNPASDLELYRSVINNQKVAEFTGKSLLFSPNETTLVDSNNNFWSLISKQKIIDRVKAFSFSSSKETVVILTDKNELELRSLDSGKILKSFNPAVKVDTVVCSPDGRIVALSTNSNSVLLWSIADDFQVQTFDFQSDVVDIVFSPDGQAVAITSIEKESSVFWDIASSKSLPAEFSLIRFSPDGKTFITVSEDGNATLRTMGSRETLHSWEVNGTIDAIAYSPGGQTLVVSYTTYEDIYDTGSPLKIEQKELWSATSGKMIIDGFESFDFSPDGSTMVATYRGRGQSTYAILHNALTGDSLAEYVPEHITDYNHLTDVNYSRDGQKVVIAFAHEAAVLSIANGIVFHLKDGNHKSASFSTDGHTLLNQTAWAVELLSAHNGRKLVTYKDTLTPDGKITFPLPVNADFSPDNRYVIIYNENENIEIYSRLPRNGILLTDPFSEGKTRLFKYSPDGKTIITANDDNSVSIWQSDTGEKLNTVQHQGEINAFVFSPDGKIIATASADQTVVLWDVSSGQKIHTLPHHAPVNAVVFSPKGELLSTASDDGATTLWRVADGQTLRTLQNDIRPYTFKHPVNAVVFAPDGQTIATASSDGTATIWSVSDGENLQEIDNGGGWGGGVTAVSFSPDGSMLLSTTKAGKSILWAVGEKKIRHTYHYELRHDTLVSPPRFNPDGQTILITTPSGMVEIWSVATGEKVQSIHLDHPVNRSDFNSDGSLIVSVSTEETITISNSHTGEKTRLIEDGSSAEISPDAKHIATLHEGNVYINNLFQTGLLDNAVYTLPVTRTCLKPEERKKYFLTDLTDSQWIERGCPQYTQAARAESK